MKKVIFAILIAFLISLVIHVVLFTTFSDIIKNNNLNINSSNLKKKPSDKNGLVNIKYVKIKAVKEYKEKTISKKVEKLIEKKQKIIKQKNKIILPKISKETDLKDFFTISKSKKINKIKVENTVISQQVKEIYEIQKLDELTQSYIKLYGDKFFKYSKVQKKYLKDNLNRIGRITQKYLEYPIISIRTKQSGINIVEFLFHPNGDISDLKITDSSNYTSLDKNTKETIYLAYKDYPKPSETVTIKIYVKYILY